MCGLLKFFGDVLRRQLQVFVCLRQDFDEVAPLLASEGGVTLVVWVRLRGKEGFERLPVSRRVDAVSSFLQPRRRR